MSYGTGKPLIVIAGQSQARGHGDTFWLDNGPDLVTPFNAVRLNYQLGADAASPITWVNGVTGPLRPHASPGSPGMGYELSLGRALYAQGHAPIIGKFAVDAAGLDAHFSPIVNFPQSPAGKNLFGQLVEYIETLQTATGSTLAVLVWDQGGTDSVDEAPASRYRANLELFVDALRDRFENFALVLAQLNVGIPLEVGAYRETVRDAQADYADVAEDTFLVNTDHVPLGGPHVDSSVHFDGNSCASIGYLLASVISPLIERDVQPAPSYVGADVGDFGAGALTPRWGAHQEGDIGILAVTGGIDGTTASLTDDAGFVEIDTVDSVYSSQHQRLTLYWCRATSNAMPSPVVADTNTFQSARIFIFRDCVEEGDPVDVYATAANHTYGTGQSLPGAITTVDRALVAMFTGAYCAGQSNPLTLPASQDFPLLVAQAQSGYVLGSGNFNILDLVTGEKRDAGSFASVSGTTPYPAINANVTIALKPKE